SSSHFLYLFMYRRAPSSTLFPYTTLFRSHVGHDAERLGVRATVLERGAIDPEGGLPPLELVPRVDGEHAGHGGRAAEEAGDGPEIGRATSELQSRENLVCRLLLEKKKKPD